MPRSRTFRSSPLALLVSLAACGDSPSSPTTPTATPAEPTVTESFSGTLAVSGSRFYSFTVGVYGNVRVTLDELEGPEDADLKLTVGLGLPRGTDCTTSVSSTVAAGPDPHLTSALDPGVYCVRVSDTLPLPEAVRFRVQIAHP